MTVVMSALSPEAGRAVVDADSYRRAGGASEEIRNEYQERAGLSASKR